MKLAKWRKSGMLTNTRTVGQIAINCNGDFVDIWIRVKGRETWYAVLKRDLLNAINNNESFAIVEAYSDGNAE